MTPPGPSQCIHNCIYCYAREAVYANNAADMLVYTNLPELVEKDLKRMSLCPPVTISTISDPCQDIPGLKTEVIRLISLLMAYSVSFVVTTKGDPSFLLDIPGFVAYEPKVVAVTIEGTADVLNLLSPHAANFETRLQAVCSLSGAGVKTVVRLDPLFKHLFGALYGANWFDQIEAFLDRIAVAGAGHIIAGTGRLSKKKGFIGPFAGTSSWERMRDVICGISPQQGRSFENEYAYQHGDNGRGYMLRRDLREDIHRKLKTCVEDLGMTFAVCQELPSEFDSGKIPNCHGFMLPFIEKGIDGKFRSISGCSACCHISCTGHSEIPCGRSHLVSNKPLSMKVLG